SWGDEALNGLNYCNWGPTNRFIMLNYDRLYVNIAFCNEFLHSTSESDAKMQEYRAEVRVLRAFSYYILTNFTATSPSPTKILALAHTSRSRRAGRFSSRG
ncbi:MAG: RagB/SusD family nutrient uptake outer membrane protein, partial [Bacteroidales bacterium]|nr:RagB/SusD family nutrient uptake outer membrane protein [Bacteroidales bacterium]